MEIYFYVFPNIDFSSKLTKIEIAKNMGKPFNSKSYIEIVDDVNKMPGAKWFQGSRINFAENLLRFKDDRVAIHFQSENFTEQKITYRELYDKVSSLSQNPCGKENKYLLIIG